MVNDTTPCKPGTRCSRSIRGLGGCEAGSCEREEGVTAVHAQRKPLTEEQIIGATDEIDMNAPGCFIRIARAIEAAHGIGVGEALSPGAVTLSNGEVELTGLKRGATRTAVARRAPGVGGSDA